MITTRQLGLFDPPPPPRQKPTIDPDDCPHPPARYFMGEYLNEQGQRVYWVACCQCGKLLHDNVKFRQPKG